MVASIRLKQTKKALDTCDNLRKDSSISINRILRWYENQEVDHGSIMGWRTYSDSLRIVGYMGFFSSSNYLCAYPIPVEYDSRMTPDCIGVMGEGLIDLHKKFCDALNLEVVPSFRFASPKINTQIKYRSTDDIKVLVALPISQDHIRIILKIIGGVSSINDGTPILFSIKPHPASNYSFDEHLIDRNNVQYTVVDDSLTTLLGDVDLFLSVASSTLVEAIMYGIPVLLVSSTQSLRENVIPEFVSEDLWDEVYSANELHAVLTQHKKLSKLNTDELNTLNSMIVGLQPNRQNVLHLLGGFDS